MSEKDTRNTGDFPCPSEPAPINDYAFLPDGFWTGLFRRLGWGRWRGNAQHKDEET